MWLRSKHGVFLSDAGRTFKHEVAIICRENEVTPLDGNISVHIELHRGRASGDTDNYIKSILDSLQGYCFKNDSQVEEIYIRRYEAPKKGRVVVTVKGFTE
jgi:Holliday junction resolvase RusA-like endonuclease